MERPERVKCATKYCRNERAPGKSFCHRCRSRKAKENNPYLYHFNALRNNARRRGKEFTLTLEQFRIFCNETGYMLLKGKNKNDYTIDRLRSSEGYSFDNIQVLSHYHNSMKQDNDDYPF
jgi:hypothetical protein